MTTTSSRPIERGAPRVQKPGPATWVKKNLFNSWFNAILTVVLIAVIGGALFQLLTWAFSTEWIVVTENFGQYMAGLYPAESYWRIWTVFAMIAALAGVSWGVLARNQKQLFGRNLLIWLGAIALFFILWPMTRPHLLWILGSMVLLVAGAALGKAFGQKVNGAASWVSGMWFLSYLIALYLFGGGPFFGNAPVIGPSIFYRAVIVGLPLWIGWQMAKRIDIPGIPKLLGDILLFVLGFLVFFQLLQYIPYWLGLDIGLKSISTSSWGGLSLTLLLAISGIALCFPAGVLLALGRRSKLPIVRAFSVAYIELVRGVPLISILFMGQVLIPLFLPEGVRPDRVVRAVIGLTIFSAAYLAENVRAGLQSIPQGQTEAAQSLGLNKPLTTSLIVLPQALKVAIPAIVGQFISLFQDTTLLGIVGLIELLGITQSLSANPKYLGDYAQAYLFIATIYWIFCYAMSYGSRRIEEALNTDLR